MAGEFLRDDAQLTLVFLRRASLPGAFCRHNQVCVRRGA
jgi:hypothetical protein